MFADLSVSVQALSLIATPKIDCIGGRAFAIVGVPISHVDTKKLVDLAA